MVPEKTNHVIMKLDCTCKHVANLYSPPRWWHFCLLTWKIDIHDYINTLKPRQNGRHFLDDTLKCISLNENVRISIKISPNFVPKGPINNIPALFQIMAWCRSGDKPLSEPMVVRLLTHICITRPQWVRLEQNEQSLTDEIFICIFLWENISILIKIPLKFISHYLYQQYPKHCIQYNDIYHHNKNIATYNFSVMVWNRLS